MKEWQCQNWFAKFRSGNFSLKSAQRSGRPVEGDKCHIKAIIDSVRHSTTCEIAEKFKVSHTCIKKKKLKQLGYVIFTSKNFEFSFLYKIGNYLVANPIVRD